MLNNLTTEFCLYTYFIFPRLCHDFLFLSVDDLCIEGLRTCYFLDFLGPKGLAQELSSQTSSM